MYRNWAQGGGVRKCSRSGLLKPGDMRHASSFFVMGVGNLFSKGQGVGVGSVGWVGGSSWVGEAVNSGTSGGLVEGVRGKWSVIIWALGFGGDSREAGW